MKYTARHKTLSGAHLTRATCAAVLFLERYVTTDPAKARLRITSPQLAISMYRCWRFKLSAPISPDIVWRLTASRNSDLVYPFALVKSPRRRLAMRMSFLTPPNRRSVLLGSLLLPTTAQACAQEQIELNSTIRSLVTKW